MYRETLRPGIALGPYPERDIPRLSWLDETAQRAIGPLVQRPVTSRIAARRFLAQVTRAGAEYAEIDAQQLSAIGKTLRAELLRKGLTNELISRAFALVREVSDRTLGMPHYDSQIVGGWFILQGMVAEMETGEGKTLTATLPASVAAMAGIPVHVISVNDYLVARDAKLMAPIYKVLGLSVGVITEEVRDPAARQAAYACDITYCSNKQIAFDYLRDRVSLNQESGGINPTRYDASTSSSGSGGRVMRGLCFGIVDEADSVLIDEAKTPLILSRELEKPFDEDIYRLALDLADRLKVDHGHFRVDGRQRIIVLRQAGKKRLEQLVTNERDFWHSARRREEMVTKALLAKYLHIRDQHYLVRDGKIEIIDENTGRTMPDRSWEAGLHQMVEAKERCNITGVRDTIGRITYQRFFRRYLRLGAMTGTATEVAGELWSVYGLRVARVASHKPSRRVRWRTLMHTTEDQKWATVVARIRMLQKKQRPVLIGTRSVDASEHLSALLDQAGLTHRVLNARQDREEAETIARAGEAGQITVATNMAGRGTDIKICAEVASRGGLHVVTTEYNQARRIDRQLFGRCGRQGDLGSFEAIVSLEDEIIMFCAPRPIIKFLRALDSGKFPLVRWGGAILMRQAQRNIERQHARSRRELLKHDLRLSDALAFTGPME